MPKGLRLQGLRLRWAEQHYLYILDIANYLTYLRLNADGTLKRAILEDVINCQQVRSGRWWKIREVDCDQLPTS